MENTTLTGNLGRDPELSYTSDSTPVCNFSLAVKNYKGVTKWVRISVFGKQAESCNQYLSKGQSVSVSGEYTFDESTGGPRIWTKKDGTAGTGFEFRANRVEFGKRNESQPEMPNVGGEVADNIPF